MATKTKLIVNLTRGECLCVGEMADRPLSRLRGLMGRSGLPAGEGLLLSPAPAIHTGFMRFPIDALFLDRELRVLSVVERLRPWRFASQRKAHAVLELSAGECARRGVEIGDQLELRDRKPVETRAESQALSDESQALSGDNHLGGELRRLQPMRVLVVSSDRRFRTVMSLLLARRNCSVTTTANGSRVTELTDRENVDVVVVESGALSDTGLQLIVGQIEGLARPVGVVLVVDEPVAHAGGDNGDRASAGTGIDASGAPVLAKWGPFEQLVEAIERVDERRGSWGSIRAGG